MSGQYQKGLECLDEADAIVRGGDYGHWIPELYLLQGNLLIIESHSVEGEEQLNKAFEIACDQHAKTFQLRAATSLARLWRDQGKGERARDLLAPIYDWFTEGFDTVDLKDARALLDELG